MAIPIFRQTIGLPLSAPVARVDTSGTQALLQGVGNLAGAGQHVAQVGEALATEEAERQSSDLYLKALSDFDTFERSLQGDADYGTYEARFDSFLKDWQGQNLTQAKPRVQRAFQQRYAPSLERARIGIRDLSRRTQIDVGRADMVRAMDQTFEMIGANPDSSVAGEAVQELMRRIDAEESAGLFTAEAAEGLRQDVGKRNAQITILSLADKDPHLARRRLDSGEFDSGLQPEEKLRLSSTIDQEIRSREAHARAMAALSRAEYSADLTDYAAFVAAGGEATPEQLDTFSEPRITEVLGDKAPGIIDDLKLAQLEGAFTQGALALPPAEGEAFLADFRQQVMADPQNFKDEAATLARLESRWDAVKKARIADPAGYVQQAIPEVRAAYDRFLETSAPEDLAAAVQQSMAAQEFLGVPNPVPLSKPVAASIAGGLAGAQNPKEQLIALSPLLAVGDDATIRAAVNQVVEAGAPAEISYALEQARLGNEPAAERLLQIITGPEIKLKGEEKKELLGMVIEDDAYAPYDEVARTQSALTGNPLPAAQAETEAALVARSAAVTGDVGRSVNDVVGHLVPLQDDGLYAVRVPKDALPKKSDGTPDISGGESALAGGFARLREELLTGDVFLQGFGPVGNPVAMAISSIVAQDLLPEARWVNSGDGFALILPGGSALADEDGNPIIVPLDQVIGAAPTTEERAREQFTPLFTPPGLQ